MVGKRRSKPAAKATPPIGIRGDRVRKAREARGYSPMDLLVRARLYPSTLSEIENGKKEVQSSTILRIAHALNCSTDYLFGLSDKMER